jgi:hypothetical protein
MSNNTGKIIVFGWKRGGPNTIWEKSQSSIIKRKRIPKGNPKMTI